MKRIIVLLAIFTLVAIGNTLTQTSAATIVARDYYRPGDQDTAHGVFCFAKHNLLRAMDLGTGKFDPKFTMAHMRDLFEPSSSGGVKCFLRRYEFKVLEGDEKDHIENVQVTNEPLSLDLHKNTKIRRARVYAIKVKVFDLVGDPEMFLSSEFPVRK